MIIHSIKVSTKFIIEFDDTSGNLLVAQPKIHINFRTRQKCPLVNHVRICFLHLHTHVANSLCDYCGFFFFLLLNLSINISINRSLTLIHRKRVKMHENQSKTYYLYLIYLLTTLRTNDFVLPEQRDNC